MQEFTDKVRALWAKKAALDELKTQVAALSEPFEALKTEVLKGLEVLELDKISVPGCGTVYRQKNFSVRVPKESAAKAALFQWIGEHKGQDVLDAMVSINSQSLNSFYKTELELAKERGDVDFAVPGIGTPEVYWTVGMRK